MYIVNIKGKCTLYKIHLGKVYIVQNTLRECVHCTTFRESVHEQHLGKMYIVQNTFRESLHCTTFMESVHCTTFMESVH